jgi:hypothetical protein
VAPPRRKSARKRPDYEGSTKSETAIHGVWSKTGQRGFAAFREMSDRFFQHFFEIHHER